MPFPGPETALASTIDAAAGENIVRYKTARPGACQAPSTNCQPLARRLNDLQKDEPARYQHRRTNRSGSFFPRDGRARLQSCLSAAKTLQSCGMLSLNPWYPVSNAPPAENGTQLPLMSPLAAARTTSKTARSAASRMFFTSSTITRRRDSSSPPNWNERRRTLDLLRRLKSTYSP
jgi:hypothetical protein